MWGLVIFQALQIEKKMKYLEDYNKNEINNIIKKNGGFFAFNNDQFNKNKKDGVKYCRLYSGLIVPKNKVDYILKKIDKATKKAIKQDINDNGIKKIVFRDCSNLELQFNYDGLNEIISYLKDYNFNKKDIKKYYDQYIKYCIKNDIY